MVSPNLRYVDEISSPTSGDTSSVEMDTAATFCNGYTTPQTDPGSPIADQEEPYDLICVGFGPASLAIAIALHDRGLISSTRVLFIERQQKFAWHAGMLLPGSRMQISFVKDLASLRDPRSHFTFLNYLHKHNRLVTFINLGTFLPLREEYNDYLTWCAKHFDDKIMYGETVTSVSPVRANSSSPVTSFEVNVTNVEGLRQTRFARHVVVAVGGRPNIPQVFPNGDKRIIHSSTYVHSIPEVLKNKDATYKVAVIGGGQSAAEIFSDLHSRYPNCKTRLIIKGQALRPSDDSPFVNEIFNPEKVDGIFALPTDVRYASLHADKATNYGVVRLELLETLYERLYEQRIREPNETNWAHTISPLTDIASVNSNAPNGRIRLHMRNVRSGAESEEDFDAVVVATGYLRNVHREILVGTKSLLKRDENTGEQCWSVGRDYRLQYEEGKLASNVGVWLQGCCEMTHGLSDTLLSILAVRGAEIVDSIFGRDKSNNTPPFVPSPPPVNKVNGHANGVHINGNDAPSKKQVTYGTKSATNGVSPKKDVSSTWRNLSRRISGRR